MYHKAAIATCDSIHLDTLKHLDLGCGRGGGISFLVNHFSLKDSTGIDICSRQIAFAKKTNKHPSSINFLQGDIENLDALPEVSKYDLVTCVETWH